MLNANYKNYYDKLQSELSYKCRDILANSNPDKRKLIPFITTYVSANSIQLINPYTNTECTVQEIINKIYNDMEGFSILTQFLDNSRNDIEEINVNAWNDITIHKNDGSIEKLPETFIDSNHAYNIIQRVLQKSGVTLDRSKPKIRGYLGSNIRITATAPPLADSNVGVVASIRIINPCSLEKTDFIKYGTANEQMLTLLQVLLKYGTSMCITGATGCGKTTLMSWLLSTISNSKRIVTIEEGVREFNLVKKNPNGEIINNIVHLVTKDSEKERERVTSEDLVSLSLTLNPDYVVVGEMKDKEAFSAQEAARTGHSVVTTVHAKSAEATYPRMTTLCMLKHNVDYKIASGLVKEAFPIVVFAKKLEDGTRRIMTIMECVPVDDNKYKMQVLWRYVTDENSIDENGKYYVKGHFEKISNISKTLEKDLIDNGIPTNVLDFIKAENS